MWAWSRYFYMLRREGALRLEAESLLKKEDHGRALCMCVCILVAWAQFGKLNWALQTMSLGKSKEVCFVKHSGSGWKLQQQSHQLSELSKKVKSSPVKHQVVTDPWGQCIIGTFARQTEGPVLGQCYPLGSARQQQRWRESINWHPHVSTGPLLHQLGSVPAKREGKCF